MNVSVVRRITSSFADLNKGTAYRGCLETFADGTITGWCMSAANPVATINLEIYLGETLLGTTRTGLKRSDISEALGFPVKAGFRFAFTDTAAETLREALEDLDAPEASRTSPERLISVRLEGGAGSLPYGPDFHLVREDLYAIAAQADRQIDQSVSITSSFADLESGSTYRGGVDGYVEGTITGWCFLAENPTAPVTLEIYLGETFLGTARTRLARPEISKVLGMPSKAGFHFSLEKCASSALLEVLSAVAQIKKADGSLEDHISVRVEGTDSSLPLLQELRMLPDEIERLASVLQRRHRELFANRAIQERDALLTAPPSPVARKQDDVKVVAYYLPQFHPFAENNEWWGEGFTEWTNVTSARPSFPNHYQPRLPADLGYYDLRLDEVQAKQVELAKKYGVAAFCYYYYWFSGTKLMTMPIDRHVDQNLDLDFCLCWANENWSRRWDGSENDVLMAQQHTEADDIAFIHSVIPYFKHPRYIKVNGAPFLMVYRISLLSDPEVVVAKWRSIVKDAGFPDLHICMAETFGLKDPHQFGVDSACQFPPHGVLAHERSAEVDDLAPDFTGKVYDYNEVVAGEIRRPDPGYLRFRTAMPSWDNTSRKGKAGHVFHNATPETFEAWLSYLVAKAQRDYPPEFRYVFINAWNEWAEGAYLEPDRRNGHNNLKAVRNALTVRNATLGEALISTGEADEDDFRRNVVNLVTTLSNANKQLLKLFSGGTIQSRTSSPFITRPSNAIQRVLPRKDGYLQLDAVNGRGVSFSAITVLRQQSLAVNGWLHVPGVTQTLQVPLLIWLVPLDGIGSAPDYVASVYDREQRQDVANALNLTGNEPWYGFQFTGDLRAVEPGSYRLLALLASESDPRGAIAVEAKLTVHVG